jgi:thimet oligopeptidase
VDEDALQPYFPLDRVLAGMFKIYQTLMDVSFEAMPQAPLWHKDVRAYAVRDRASGKIMSYFYMDLFPREGKYGHAAAFGLVPGHVLADGTYQGGVSSIVANFTAPTSDQPSLLRFDEVETLFHEFGHIMHGVLTRSRYGSFAGTAVKRDFVETLSQIFENWVWDMNMLRMMSGHHKTGAPIPDKLLNALVQSRLANVGTNMMRQVHLASVDMIYYTSTPKSAADVHAVDTWNKTQLEYTGMPATPNTHYIGAFGHVMSGYASGYYSYLWSEVFAHDMFSRFRQGGFLSTSLGRELRYKVLEKGGMEPPMNLLKDFLGRLPNADAFMRSYKL